LCGLDEGQGQAWAGLGHERALRQGAKVALTVLYLS
jgi:hypothetical protein